jgi:hypothetical protein
MARVKDHSGNLTAGHEKSRVSRVFIPCPVCQAPIELPAGGLPKRIACPKCESVLER